MYVADSSIHLTAAAIRREKPRLENDDAIGKATDNNAM
jgi:hypothetical protein